MNKMKKFSEIMADPKKKETLKRAFMINLLVGQEVHNSYVKKAMDAELKRRGIRKNESQ